MTKKSINTESVKEALDMKIWKMAADNSRFETPTKIATCRAIYELVSVLEKLGELLDYASQDSLIDLKAKEAEWEKQNKKEG